MLNVDRAVQGVGGAIMFAVSLALIAQEFAAGRERAMAMADLRGDDRRRGRDRPARRRRPDRRPRLAVGVPAQRPDRDRGDRGDLHELRESRDPNATRIDWAGLATFSTALFLLVLALLRGNQEGWGSDLILGLFGGAAALLGAFIAIERRVSEPMLPLRLFRQPRLHRRPDRRPSRSRARCSRCSST